MCGGWITALKPEPYQLVILRELVVEDGQTKIDINHVGYWGVGSWMVLANEKVDGTKLPNGTFKGMGIVNIYGWQKISDMVPNV